MATEWYTRLGGAQLGPFSPAKLRQLAQERKVKPDTLVRKGADGEWVPASRVKGLFEVSKPPPPLPTPREESEGFAQPQFLPVPESPPLQPAQPQQDVNRGLRLGLGLAIGCVCGIVLLCLGMFILVFGFALASPRFFGSREKANRNAARVQIEAFTAALEKYNFDTNVFPGTEQGLDALLHPVPGIDNLWDGPYINKPVLPKDPWGNDYQYAYPPERGSGKEPDVWSIGPDGEDNTEDDICSWL